MSTTTRAGATPGQHTALKLLLQGDVVAVQAADARGAAAETLSVQLSSGQVGWSWCAGVSTHWVNRGHVCRHVGCLGARCSWQCGQRMVGGSNNATLYALCIW